MPATSDEVVVVRSFEAHCAMPYIAKLFEMLPVLVDKQYIGLHRQVLA